MPSTLTFISLVIVIWATGLSIRENVPKIIFLFLLSQSVFTLVCWLAAQQWMNVGQYYTVVYGIGVVLPATFAVGISLSALGSNLWPLILAEIATFSGMIYTVDKLWGHGPWAYRIIGYVASAYAVSGFFTILSLSVLSSPTWDKSRLIVGLFLLSQGILHLLLVANAQTRREEAMQYANWTPALVAIGLFLWLGHSLAK